MLITCLTGCGTGYLLVEKSGYLRNNTDQIKKIVCISPTYVGYEINRKEIVSIASNVEKKQIEVEEIILLCSKLNYVEVELIKSREISEEDVDFLNEYQRLNKAMSLAISNQSRETEHFFEGFFKYLFGVNSGINTTYWTLSPEIPSEFSYMAEKYGTPYFSIQGITSIHYPNEGTLQWLIPPLGLLKQIQDRDLTVFYHLVVDVEKSEVIFHEVRSTYRKPLKRVLEPMIYESYNLLKR